MSTASFPDPIPVEQYLAGEQNARIRNEYVEGVVYAMVGATNAHNTIATNATIDLGSQLRGKTCRVFNSDTKIRVRLSRGTRFYYPDSMVVCRFNSEDETFQDAPVVIVEVISESTRRTDENEKRDAYLSIDSLCVYVRIEQSSSRATVDRRGDSGFTREVYVGNDAIIPLPEIDCELRLADVYDGLKLQPEPTEWDENDHQ